MEPFERFNYESITVTASFIERRIIATCKSPGWQFFIAQIQKKGLHVSQMRTIEVGCGTATASLMAAMLGADVTLLDIDEEALRVARQAFSLYNLKATFLKADVLKEPLPELLNSFDYAFSGGLVEHFEGNDRTKVMAFHGKVMKKNGFVLITSPNLLSIPYWGTRLLSRLLGQWTLNKEIPFSFWELMSTGKKAGFSECAVIGSADLTRDILVYGFAVIALFLKLLPESLKNKLKKQKMYAHIKNIEVNMTIPESDIVDFVKKHSQFDNKATTHIPTRKSLKDYLSSGLFFYGTNWHQLSDSDKPS